MPGRYLLSRVGLALGALLAACRSTPPPPMPAHTNALAGETSPYLLQHAHNPVDWHPWGEAALAEARAQDKLLIVSIGYAACHWCHVMERESFEDTTVAAAMNEHYVSIKVDREERPDVDDVYMTACHLSGGGSCGWPLNAIALPDGRPVWAGTYFPRERWLDILAYFVKLRAEEPAKLEAYATQIAAALQTESLPPAAGSAAELDAAVPAANAERLVQLSDPRFGGLGGAPKFPMPVAYDFALTQLTLTGDGTLLPAVEQALTAMARGGIYDQLGGGFARYSTDAAWHAPHFEKMLYDNAQLVGVYARAYRLTGSEEFAGVIRETLAFVERELTDPAGGFYSSLDADSEGEEGKYYVWTHDELAGLLTDEELAAVELVYDARPGGNWEDGKIILHRQGDLDSLAAKPAAQRPLTLDAEGLRRVLAAARAKLLAAREARVRPGLDDKVLVSWNALMIEGYVEAYLALGEPAYLATAERQLTHLRRAMLQGDGRLLRTSAKGRAHVNAFLDDYANLAQAALSLYQATFDERHLALARQLVDYALAHFSGEGPLLYFTSDLDPDLVARRIDADDNVTPSSNAVLADALWTLGTILGEGRYTDLARAMVAAVTPRLAKARQPAYAARWLSLYARMLHGGYEVAIVGADAPQRRLALARGRLLPQATLLGAERADQSELRLLEGKGSPGETLIYVCRERSCRRPTASLEEALALLGDE